MALTNIVDIDIKNMKKSKMELMESSLAPSNKNWVKSEIPLSNIDVYLKNTNENGCCCVCGITVMNVNAEALLKTITNSSNWKKIDSMTEKTEYIDLSKTSRMIHFVYSGITGIVSKRDIVFMENIIREDDGTIMVVLSPTELNMFKKQPDYVRAEMRSGGWIIKQISETQCYVVYYLNIDFKFNMINQQIINMFASKIPSAITKISNLV